MIQRWLAIHLPATLPGPSFFLPPAPQSTGEVSRVHLYTFSLLGHGPEIIFWPFGNKSSGGFWKEAQEEMCPHCAVTTAVRVASVGSCMSTPEAPWPPPRRSQHRRVARAGAWMLVVSPGLVPATRSTLRHGNPSEKMAQRFHAHTTHRPCGRRSRASLPASLGPPRPHLSTEPPEWLPEKLSLEDKCGSWDGIRGSSKLTDTRHQSKQDFQATWMTRGFALSTLGGP